VQVLELNKEKEMNAVDMMNLKFLRSKLGESTSRAALEEAVENDEMAFGMHWTDPAKARFVRLRDNLFEYARLLEIEEKENATASN
jgi:hypothetical protein